ncbi:IS630 family transposase, partial [Poseidonocella sp. HB161398]|uniref:IS630 family transposase n=1 Tax=Poseidonocella sp. HB161398 TaxID=2320855 RepID=UPI001107F7E2
MGGRVAVPIDLSDEERSFLEAQLRRHKAARSLSDRCRIVLRCAEGMSNKEIAASLGHSQHTVGKWRRRFAEQRLEGLSDEYREGRPRTVSDEQVAEVIKRTLESTPRDATHWSIRSMAAKTGLSHATVRRIWNAFGLQPHRRETFKLSTDPLFVDKVHDVVALYMSPPTRAI